MMKQNSSTRTNITMLALVQLLLLASFSGNAQNEDPTKFGDNPDKCRESISLYREYYKQKNYEDAMMGWRWAFKNCPEATKNIVINGPTMMEHMIKKHEADAALKKAYIDTLMMIYDKRIELYPEDKAAALGRKGMDQYDYATEDYGDAYNTMKQALELGGNETEAGVLAKLYTAGMKQLVAKKVEMDELYDLYDKISAVVDANMAKGAEDKSYKYYEQAKGVVDQNFERIAQEEQYIGLMKPKVEAAPTDAALLEKVSTMMVKRKWTSNPFYLETSEKLHKLNPSATSAYNLYEGHAKKGNDSEAKKFLEESVKLETNPTEKADRMLKLAKVYGAEKSFAKARSTAQEAASLRSGWGEPFIYIGDLYLSTSTSCGDDACSQKYGIWAAEDMFNKAKSVDSSVASEAAQKAASCRKYYPTKKDCFFLNIQDGQAVTVGGWIGVETNARFAE